MNEPIYYSKVEFIVEGLGGETSTILLDLIQKELSFQVVECKTTIYSAQSEVIFSYGLRLTEDDIQSILPYCSALDFEPFRGRQMELDDAGFIGYRDVKGMKFRAVTDSYLPMIELPMDYLYDKAHTWPSEKLYRFLSEKFFKGKKKLRTWF